MSLDNVFVSMSLGLSFGEDATRNSINVETQAYNQQQATIPDNDGFQPKGKAIIPGGIPTIATNFPYGSCSGKNKKDCRRHFV